MTAPRWDGKRWRIQARKDGRRFSFSSSMPGSKGRKECQRKYEAWLYGEASGEKTVQRVAAEFLEDVKARLGEHSPAYVQYERYFRLYIAPACGSRKLCKITLRDWQALINAARGRKTALSEKSLKTLRSVIMAIVKYGYQDYQCDMPRGTLYIPQGRFKKERECLQKEDVRRLFEPSELWYHPLFCFLCVTGMRPGEALGLQVSDLQGDRVIIRRSIAADGSITNCKNKNARRMVPIGATALGILKATIERNERNNLRTAWIFCGPDGGQGNQSTMRNHWHALKVARGLPGSVYSLRHTFISIMKGVMPEQTIKGIVGHSVSMQTFGTYGHILNDEPGKAARIIDLTFGEVNAK